MTTPEPARLSAEEIAWDAGVDAAFRGAVMRQNGEDVKRRNPYRGNDPDPRTHGLNHAPLPEGTWLAAGFCAGCDAARLAAVPASGGLAASVGALAEEWPEPTEEGEGRLLARIRALLAAHLAADGATGQEGT